MSIILTSLLGMAIGLTITQISFYYTKNKLSEKKYLKRLYYMAFLWITLSFICMIYHLIICRWDSFIWWTNSFILNIFNVKGLNHLINKKEDKKI